MQHKQLNELNVFEVRETLKQYEEEVAEIRSEKKKTKKQNSDQIPLVTDKNKSSSSKGKEVVEFEQ